MALFRYSPYAPSWGKFGVNALIVGSFFSFYAKAVPKSPSRWPMLQTFSLLTLLQIMVLSFGGGYLACVLLHTLGVRCKRRNRR